jgi:hypothetical protein
MGSLYELAMLVLFEIIVFGAALADRKVVLGGQESPHEPE